MTIQTDPTAAAVGIAREVMPILKESGNRLTTEDMEALRERLSLTWPDMEWSGDTEALTEELDFLIQVEDSIAA